MNKVIDQIRAHRSIRKYKNIEVDQSVLDQILEAASCTSTSGNMQAYSIIVTKSPEMKKKMFESHFKQTMLKEAPVFLTFCADFNRMRKWIKHRDASNNFDNFMSFMIASIDATLASQTAVLAAESLGLGVCYMGTTLASAHEIGETLNLPENVIPIVGFSLGYPDEKPLERKRLPLSSLVHYEKYYDYTNSDVEQIYEEKEREGFKRYTSDVELSKLMERQGIENLAQVYTQLKYTEKSHLKYSDDLLGYMRKQNFL